MKTKKKNDTSKYSNFSKNSRYSKCIKGALVVSMGVLGLTGCGSSKENSVLVLTKDKLNVEYGEEVSTNIADYIDSSKVSSYKDLIKNTKEKDNLKKEKKQSYPKIGEYEINFEYKDEKATVKVIVKDTTKPEITAPDSIDVVQYTNLADFDFDSLLSAKDYSKLDKWKIDTSKVDVNTIGEYELKVSIQDKYKNKATKKIKVNVVQAPEVGEGEVAVTEIVKDENGNVKTVVTKKAQSEVSKNDTVASTKPVTNAGTISSSSNSNTAKPSGSSGTAKPSTSTSTSNSGNSSSSSSNSSSSNSSASKPSNSNTSSGGSSSSNGNGGNSSSGSNNTAKPSTPTHTHDYNIPITKTVHHDAVTHQETKVIKAAYDEPIYESRYICNNCGFSTTDGGTIADHITDVCDSGYHVSKVQSGTKHHDAVTETVTVVDRAAYDEQVTTGYRCSCGATK